MSKIDVLIIVHATDDFNLFQSAYASLSANIHIPFEITILNILNEDVHAYCKQLLQDKKLKYYVYRHKEISYAILLNFALSVLKNKYIVVVHPDSRIAPYWVDKCVEFMDINDTVGLIDVCGYNARFDEWNKPAISSMSMLAVPSVECVEDVSKIKFVPILYGDGFCYIFRTNIIKHVIEDIDSKYIWLEREIAFTFLQNGYLNYCTNIKPIHLAKNPMYLDKKELQRYHYSLLRFCKLLKHKLPNFQLLFLD